jgi:hypothetical protein
MRKDSLIPSLLGIPPIQISREQLLVKTVGRQHLSDRMR